MNFRSSFLEALAEDKNRELNLKVRRQAAEYHIEVLFLQYNTLLYNCERYFHEIINFRLFNEFIVPLFDGKMYDQYLVVLMVRSLANVILRRIWVKLLLLIDKLYGMKLTPDDRKKNARKNRWQILLCQPESKFNNKLKKKSNPD